MAERRTRAAAGRPSVELRRLRDTSWTEHAMRFAFGGVATALAGLVAHRWGASVGGLFLGFPAILPAALSVVRRHDGERAAGEDALGAILGSIGLAVFALVVWTTSASLAPWLVLVAATGAWLAVAVLAWWIYTMIRPQRPQRPQRPR